MTTSAVLSRTGEDRQWPQEATGQTPGGEGEEEVIGDVSGSSEAGGESEAHAEVGIEGAESDEEFSVASSEALAQQEGEEEATGDLLSEGYEVGGAGEEAAGPGAEGFITEAGEALEGTEFIPLLGAFAAKVIPMLASSVGPSLIRLVQRKLSPRARRILAKTRPGGDMVSVLQKLVAQAMKRPEALELTEAVDEALVEEMTQAMEVILGTDDRIRIKNTVKVPWRRYCALRIEFPTGAVYRGTGFFIGNRTLATAGHCVYMHNQGGWARRIEVIPACDGTHRPFRSAYATTFKSTVGWTKDKVPAADYGAIILPAGAFPGQQFGRFGFKSFPTQTLLAKPAVLAGYPGDKPFAELWGMRRKIKAATSTNLIYDIDTMGGQSGAPVYVKDGGKRYVVGIHNYGASTGNSATRVTPAVVANFKKWGAIGTPPTTPAPAPTYKAAQALAMAGASDLDE